MPRTPITQPRHDTPRPSTVTSAPASKVRTMHDDVAVWDGCGSCAAEPYWIEIGAELERPRGDEEAEVR